MSMMGHVGVGAARLGRLLVGLAFAWGGAAQAQTIDTASVGVDAGVGARAMGMGGAFSALSDDATAISWNPAGAAAGDRPMLSAGYDPWARIEWDHPARTVSPWSYDAFKETAKSKLFSYDSTATTTYQGDPQGPQSVHRTGDARLLWPTLVNADGAAANQRQADTFQVRLGTEYRLRASRSIPLPLRAGGVFHRQLTREADAKPVRGIGATAGLGVAAPHFSLDVAWVLGTGKLGVDGTSEKVKRNAQRLCVSASIKP
jgi:hypothetical protein